MGGDPEDARNIRTGDFVVVGQGESSGGEVTGQCGDSLQFVHSPDASEQRNAASHDVVPTVEHSFGVERDSIEVDKQAADQSSPTPSVVRVTTTEDNRVLVDYPKPSEIVISGEWGPLQDSHTSRSEFGDQTQQKYTARRRLRPIRDLHTRATPMITRLIRNGRAQPRQPQLNMQTWIMRLASLNSSRSCRHCRRQSPRRG